MMMRVVELVLSASALSKPESKKFSPFPKFTRIKPNSRLNFDEFKFFRQILCVCLLRCWKCNFPINPNVRWVDLFDRSICHNFLKRAVSYSSMPLSEHLVQVDPDSDSDFS